MQPHAGRWRRPPPATLGSAEDSSRCLTAFKHETCQALAGHVTRQGLVQASQVDSRNLL